MCKARVICTTIAAEFSRAALPWRLEACAWVLQPGFEPGSRHSSCGCAGLIVWGGGVDCFFILGVLVGNRPRKRFRYFFIPRDFGRLPPGFGRSFGRGFGRGFGRKNASDIFASLGIPGAIAWHVGWKIYRSIVSNAGNHAKIFGPKIKILRFAFERHV